MSYHACAVVSAPWCGGSSAGIADDASKNPWSDVWARYYRVAEIYASQGIRVVGWSKSGELVGEDDVGRSYIPQDRRIGVGGCVDSIARVDPCAVVGNGEGDCVRVAEGNGVRELGVSSSQECFAGVVSGGDGKVHDVDVVLHGANTSEQVDTRAARVDGVKSIGDGDSVVSERTLINREKRAKKRNRKIRKQERDSEVPEWRRKTGFVGYRGAFGSCSDEVRVKLADTRAQRLIAENEACVRRAKAEADSWDQTVRARRKRESLRSLQVDQRIELTRSRDLDKIKKRDEVRVLRDTETSKVAVERAFGTLAATGNIPFLAGGSVETVVSSGSISPNSSVSEAEVRKLQKDFADSEAEQLKVKKFNDVLVRRMRAIQLCHDRGDLEGAKKISDEDCQAMYEESAGITLDEDGVPQCYTGDCYDGYVDAKGRFHFGQDMNAFVESFY